MAKERVLIAVKTYPVISKKYFELACTAGFRQDGSWVRIYPIPFRRLDIESQFKKYQWIELELSKNPKDPRPESYYPTNIDGINLLDTIGTERYWAERKRIIIEQNIIHTNLTSLIEKAKRNELSLAIFKPKKIEKFLAEPAERNWDKKKLELLKTNQQQQSLFEDMKRDFKVMPKLPYKFSYQFVDDEGNISTLMIEDWEIGQLYWNCLKGSDEKTAIEKVKQKYMDDFAKTKDLYLFLGTTRQFHGWAKNPFVIIGTFHPPFERQFSLL